MITNIYGKGRRKARLPFYLFTLLLLAASCSDFDDYNSDPLDRSESANKTLWENISGNSSLTDFAALLQKSGYDKILSRPTFYTVFAPLNGTYDATALMQEDSATLRNHFAENHIAYYNHQMAGEVDERIQALNEKSYDLKGTGTYTFGDVAVSQTNLPSVNGVMHLLNGEVPYRPNIYEYIFQAPDRDSLAAYFKHYEHSTLDEENSTLGPVVNGKQTYIDSVMVTTNDLFSSRGGGLGMRIADEDSSYTMMMPSNEEWERMYKTIKPYYNYINTTVYQDVPNATSERSYPQASATVDGAYYSDSIARRIIARTLMFNNNSRLNRWVENGGVYTDTILTSSYRLTNPREYLAQTKEKVTMSNGFARLVDSMAIRPWDTFAPEVSRLSVGKVFNSSPKDGERVTIDNIDTTQIKLKNNATSLVYFHATPSGPFAKPSVVMMLPDALSTAYNIYVVLVPPNAVIGDSTALPNQLDFEVNYCLGNGTLRTQKLLQKVENNPLKVDTVYAGRFTFPTCYYGLGDNVAPNLKITTDFGSFSPLRNKYTRDIRIAAVIMRPVEYDEYLGNTH